MDVVKLNRVSAWVLSLVVLVYIVTGLAMVRRFGMDSIVSVRLANTLHLSDSLLFLLVAALIAHAGFCIYGRAKREFLCRVKNKK
ncbi:Uncharacterised protein [uncultured archaeon]|nr:Uncharacterised protein [uncultured archaeon]